MLLDGDLNQMCVQKRFLSSKGYSVGQTDVYPTINENDIERAMNDIFNYSVEGWWHYKKQYEEFGICTEEEFMKKLDYECDLT